LEHTSHKTDHSREADQPIRIGGTILGAHRHICAFFKSHDDQYCVLLPFIKDGLKSGEKAVHIVYPKRRDEHVRQLRSAGIDVAATQQNGQLDLLDWAEGGTRAPRRSEMREAHLSDLPGLETVILIRKIGL